MPKFTFDTDRIDALMDEYDAAIHRITSTDVEINDETGAARHNDPNKAQVSRDLLYAASVAGRLQSEVEALYWQFKGYPDPTERETSA